MAKQEIEQVLTNWIAEANSPLGRLPGGADPAEWVARRFLAWWQERLERPLEDAEAAVASVRSDLNRLGGWENAQLGEAMHGLIHASDALAEIRALLTPAAANHEDEGSFK